MKIFLDSVPKAGAHLVEKALALLGFRRSAGPLGSSTLYGRNEWIKRLTRSGLGTSDAVVLGIELATPVRATWVRRRLAKIADGTYGRGHVRHSEHFAWILGELLVDVHDLDPGILGELDAGFAEGTSSSDSGWWS